MLQARAFKHIVRSSLSSAPKSRQYSNSPMIRLKASSTAHSLSFRTQLPRSSRYAAPLVVSFAASGGKRFQSSSSTPVDKTSQLFENITGDTPIKESGTFLQNKAAGVFEQLSETVQNSAEIAPHWNMLKEAGLNFGYLGIGPSSIARGVTEIMHVGAGMPWWAALAATALLYRAAFFYPMIRSSHMGAIAQAIAPAQREIKERYTKMDIDQQQKMALMQQEMRYLSKKTGYSMGSHFGPIVLQGIFTFGVFRFARNLATVPDIGLSDGGLLWLSYLHYADPYYILPIITGLTMHFMARVNINRSRASGAMVLPAESWMTKGMLWGLPAITVAFLSGLPAAVQIPMSVLSLTTAGTQSALNLTGVRKFFKIAPFPKGVRTSVDVKGRPKPVDRNAPRVDLISQMQDQLGLGGKEKPSDVEKARGKAVLKSAREYDAKRRQRLREQEEQRNRL